MDKMNTPIERFYPSLWDSGHALITGNPILPSEQLEALPFYFEPYEDATNVVRTPEKKLQNVPPAISEPNSATSSCSSRSTALYRNKACTCWTVMIQLTSLTPSSDRINSEPFYLRLKCTGSK